MADDDFFCTDPMIKFYEDEFGKLDKRSKHDPAVLEVIVDWCIESSKPKKKRLFR